MQETKFVFTYVHPGIYLNSNIVKQKYFEILQFK